MIKLGFNLLLFVVIFIIFIGYCWSVKIKRNYDLKMENFTQATPGEPAFINSDTPTLSTQEYELLHTYINKDKSNSSDIVCTAPVKVKGNIPSVAPINYAAWRKNITNIKSYPGTELINLYIPSSNTQSINMGGNEKLSTIVENTLYDSIISPVNPQYNNIIAYNDDLIYKNVGKEPWNRHPVQNSIPIDPKVNYTNAYYYEFDNITYLKKLKFVLTVPCELLADAILTSNWSDIVEPEISNSTQNVATGAYTACVQYIYTKINSADSMILPSEVQLPVKTKIQIVHDIFKSYKIHTTSPSMFLIYMELVLYRHTKYNGKHVEVVCTAKKNNNSWIIHVVAIRILGIVSEESIGIFPVIPVDPLSVEQLPVNADISTVTSIIDSPEKQAYIQELVDIHEKTYNLLDATDTKLHNLIAGIQRYNEVRY